MSSRDKQAAKSLKLNSFIAADRGRSVAHLTPVVRAVVARTLRERPDHPDVQDATHEVLRRALEAQGSPQQLRAWVAGIARHVAVDVIRRRQVQRVRELSTTESVATQATVLQLSDPSPSPERRLALVQDARQLTHALNTLSDQQRRALWLYHVEGVSYREIAESMGVSLGTVCTWISRARVKVAQHMKEHSSS